MTLLGALVVLLYLRRRNLDCLRKKIHNEDITSAPSLSLLVFRRKLKTRLFRQSYADIIL